MKLAWAAMGEAPDLRRQAAAMERAGYDTLFVTSGHTGWRRTEVDGYDGGERFQRLYDSIYVQWHEKRKRQTDA